MLGGGQKAEEGSKQSNLCHFIPKIFALQFSPAINILLVAQILLNRKKQQFETDCNFLKCIGNYRLKDSAYDNFFINSYLTSIEVDV